MRLKKSIEKKHISNALACCFIVAFMVCMLAKPQFYLASARQGLALFASSVLPSLFPFYFCSLLLTYTGAVGTISRIGRRPVAMLYNAPKESAYVLFLSMLCGYPVGAGTIAELYEAGAISKRDARVICAFCSTSGPVFMLGTIGGAVFHSQAIGWIILASHYLGALINGLLYRNRSQSSDTYTLSTPRQLDSIMSNVIARATINMLYVGGYIVICGMLADTLELIGFCDMLTGLGEFAQPLKALCYGIIEMTRGSIECAACSSPRISIPLCSAIVSFGGLSITLQCYTFLSKCDIGMGAILLRKLTQCLISALIAFALSFCI